MTTPHHFRSIFISDVHLGAKGSQAEALLAFLQTHTADTYYLVGDIIDGWQLAAQWYWPQSHNDVVQYVLERGRLGAKLWYLPGNHDDMLRISHLGQKYGAVEIIDQLVHEGVDGKRYLVIHGDQFDVVVKKARWLAGVGDWLYNFALFLNLYINMVRRIFGKEYWSFSAWAKQVVKRSVNKMGNFEERLAETAYAAGAQGVVCGHIHFAAIKDVPTQAGPLRYMNCGDWVESCTAIVECHSGEFEIIKWPRTL